MSTVHRIPSDGVRIAVEDWQPTTAADVPPLLMLHGGGQTRHSWAGAAERAAARGHRVLAADLRGHGDSDWHPDGHYEVTAHAGDALAVCDALGVRPILVGASLGGLTGMVLEGRVRPRTLEALILVDIVPRMNADGVSRIREFMLSNVHEGFPSLEAAAEAVAAYNPHRSRPASIDGLRKNLRERGGRWYWHWDPATMQRRAGETREVDHLDHLADALAAVEVPTMLVRGRQSDLVDDDTLDAFRSEYPHIRVTDVSGAGHMVAGDRNDVFADAVEAFVATL